MKSSECKGGEPPIQHALHACRHLQLGNGGGCSRRPRARIRNESALEAGLQFLVASGFRPTHHGPEVWEWSRAEGEAARANKVLQVCLTGNREPSVEIVLNAARGVVRVGHSII